MILESLIVATCMYGTGDSCNQLARHYYKEKKLDLMVKTLKRKYSDKDGYLFAAGTVIFSYTERRVNVPIYKSSVGTVIVNARVDDYKLLFRRDF